MDLFRCESLRLKTHWVLLVMDQCTRRIIGFGVHAGDIDGIALCRLFNTAIAGQRIPHYLSSDNDPLFRYQRWRANLRILGIEEIKSIPYTPRSHPFVERFAVNISIIPCSGMRGILSENSRDSGTITTRTDPINR